MTSNSKFFRGSFWSKPDASTDHEERTRPNAAQEIETDTTGMAATKEPARTMPLVVQDPKRVRSDVKGTTREPLSSKLLSVKAAAEYMGVSPRTLERYRVMGGGPLFRRFGNGKKARIFYHIDDLDAFMSRVYASTSEYDRK